MAYHFNRDYHLHVNDKLSPGLPPRFETRDCSVPKFKALARDPRTGKIDSQATDEAISMIQAESEHLFVNPSRPASKKAALASELDFLVKDTGRVLKALYPNLPKITHVDIKTPVGSYVLGRGNPPRTLTDMAYSIGRNCVAQKGRFVGR